MKHKNFAKIFETEQYGQILVNMDVDITTHRPGVKVAVFVSSPMESVVAIVLTGTGKMEELERVFDRIDLNEAVRIVRDRIIPLIEDFKKSLDGDDDASN